MFRFLGSILDVLFMVGLGSFAFFRPRQLASKQGTPEDIDKRVRLTQDAGQDLIETDQREEICGFIIKAGAIMGFNSADEDVTEEWREW